MRFSDSFLETKSVTKSRVHLLVCLLVTLKLFLIIFVQRFIIKPKSDIRLLVCMFSLLREQGCLTRYLKCFAQMNKVSKTKNSKGI